MAIASTLTTFLESVGIDFMRCVGQGTDGCSVMVGNNNSVYKHLRAKNEKLQLVKCVCHSAQATLSKHCPEIWSS